MSARRKSVRRQLLGVPILLAAVVAALVTPVGAAQAAVAGSTAKPAAASASSSSSASSGNAASAAGTGGVGSSKSKQSVPVKPSAPPKPKAAATVSPDTARKLRAAAAVHALAATTVPDTCSGAIQPDTIYPCTGTAGPDTFTVQLTTTADRLIIQASTTNGNAFVSVTAPDGSAVSCQAFYGPWQCPTTGAGTYSIEVVNSGSDFTLDYRAVASETTCATANTSFAAPDIQGSLAAGSVGDCYNMNLPTGSVLNYQVTGEPTYFFDANGVQQCVDSGPCTLGGTAPYRVTVSDSNAAAVTYTLRLNSISNAQGCVAATQQTYGQIPDSSSAIRCRSVTVPTTGLYSIYAVWDGGSPISTLYNLDGSVACTNFGPNCQLTAGTYNFVMQEDLSYPLLPFGIVFIAANESRGCVTSGDTGFASGPATGTFSGLGEEICLNLPTASGKSVYVLNQPTADGSFPPMQVVDATGAQQCSDQYFTYDVCPLSGTAPFRLILSDRPAGEGYKELVQRTDSSAGCTAWPQSGFGGSWGVQTSLSPSAPAVCLSIPANAHSVGEMIDYTNTANKVNAAVYVNDPAGKQICIGNSLAFCSYQSGVAYTALLMTPNSVTDTYKLVRRDVSSSAPCAAPGTTTVGGPSTQLVLTSDLDAACFHVAAATTDRWWTDVRAVAPDKAGAVLAVTDPTGKIVCREWGVSCNVTGSTGYQVVVIASGYAGVTIPAHVDVWRVGTASGWASQCTTHSLSVSGFAVRSGTLTENSTAYCAVVPIQPSQGFAVYGFDNAAGVNTVAMNMFLPSDWSNGIGLCQQLNVGTFRFNCTTQSSDPAGTAVFLVTPGAAPAPVSYTMQGVTCKFSCAIPPVQATISAVSPAQGAVGVDRITVTGTGLTMGTQVNLASNGQVVTYPFGTSPVSINADGTSLTVDVATYGAVPGKYDVLLDSPSYTSGTPSPGYLPNAFTLTAPPPPPTPALLVPVGPTRILDTRHGTGAPQAPVAAGGVVKLQVAGVAGVPTTGVTSVVLNVTVTGPAAGGYVTVYPDGTPRPTVSSLNFSAGETIPNLVVVPVVNGKVDLYNGSGGTLSLIADITGYYTSSGAGSALNTVGPTRILDTRHGVGATQAPVAVGGVVQLQVDGVAGVPTTGVTAVVMNVTVTGPTGGGYVTVYPDGAPRPTVSNLNFSAGETIPNLVVVPVVNGKVDLYNGSSGTLNLVADITGYYASSGAAYYTVGPQRVMDTRSGTGGAGGVVPAGSAAVLPIISLLGYPAGNVTAVVLNVTVTGPATGGYLTVYPDSVPRPTASNLNFSAGETIPNLVVVPVVNGNVVFYNGSGGNVQIVADAEGYFAS